MAESGDAEFKENEKESASSEKSIPVKKTKENEGSDIVEDVKHKKLNTRASVAYFGSHQARDLAIKFLDSYKSESNIKKYSPDNVESDLIQFIFSKCVGGTFNIEKNNVIKEPLHVLIILELLADINGKSQLHVLELLQQLLKKSVKNLQACTKAGLIEKLLKRLPCFEDEAAADKAIDLIGDLATYSITVRELKCFFSALQRTEAMQWPPHALKLIEILKKMPEKHGPDVYFNFDGQPAGSITVPPISKWPHQNGFTFVTWLQLDAEHLSPSEQNNRPHLYCFVNNRGIGYMSHFSGPMLVIEIRGKNDKKQTILVKSKFEPLMWYHVCVAHTYNRFKSSEVRIFVNGQMTTSSDITIPVNKEPMDKCFIGGSHINDKIYAFKGQMSAVYLIAEPLTQSAVIALYRLGPGYKGKFKFKNEVESTIAEADKKLIYEGKLSQNLLFTYNPKAVDGELCLESSPSENPSCFYHSPHALMMKGVQSVVTHSLQAAMHSLGGIQMLFPLFTQLDCPLYGENEPNKKICSLLLSLIYDLLRGSFVCQQQLLQSQGFMIIGNLLQKSSPVHLTEETVDILLGLARYFMATPSASGLLGGLMDHILLEPSIWIKTPLSLQCNLLSLFATGYVGCLDYAGYIRKEVGVPRLILMLRKYYSVAPASLQGKTSQEEIISLRAFVLLLVKQMIIKDNGILEDELKSILVYLAVEENEENFKDVIQVLLAVMCEKPLAIIPLFDRIDGFHVFFKLLVAHDEEIRLYSLKIICAYMQQLPIRRKLDLVEKYSFVSKVGQQLSIFPITMATYNALFEFLTARPTKLISYNRHAIPDTPFIMYHPTVLPIIVSLLLNERKHLVESKATDENDVDRSNEEAVKQNMELTTVFLSDLMILLNNNNDNKRLLLQLMCWQDWLFSLAYLDHPKNKDEVKITDSVFSIIKMLLYYAIQHEKDGWRVWVDTLSILHAKVSKNNPPTAAATSPNQATANNIPNGVSSETSSDSKSSSIGENTPSQKVPPTPKKSPYKQPSSPKKSPYKQPSSPNNDKRKEFFEKLLLKESGSNVIEDNLRRARSENNLLEDKDNEENSEPARPRSASPTFQSSNDINPSFIPGEKEFEKSSEENSSSSKPKEIPNIEIELDKDNINDKSVDDDASNDQPKSPDKPKTRPYIDIPEFSWSPNHQRLLTELLFSIEKDLQVWKSHTRKNVADFVSSRENGIYIMNLCHMVSILSDSIIFCCGGLLPLLSSATSQDFSNDVLEACGGMTLDTGFSFLNRILNIVDIIAYSSSSNFASVEMHRNISAGGMLRQCIRLVFCGSARNRVVCRQRERPSTGTGHIHPKSLKETKEAIKTLIASTKPATDEDPVQNIPGHMTTITHPEKLLQDSDINRLRSLVYREVEDSRQSQYVSFVVIYFVAVLMVARYRDILDHDIDFSKPSASDEKSSQLSIDDKIELAFNSSTLLLREILFDFSHYLSKVLVGSRGQDLISEGLGSLKSEESTVELVMLLCSQEWQNALQRQAGTAFMDLVDEGRLLSHATRDRIVITGSEARDIMNERENFENFKHATFETQCTKTMISYIDQYRVYDRFFKAKKKRNSASATSLMEKIFDVLTSKFGAWPLDESQQKHYKYYKLDRWEDMQRRRVRFIRNPFGTSHLDATLRPGSAEVIPPDKPPPLKYHLLTQQNYSAPGDASDSDMESDGATNSPVKEEDKQQHQAGSILFSTDCQIISPGFTVPGTLAITLDSLYFTGDEESEEVAKTDQQLLNYNDCLNVKCSFVNIVSIMARRYILQNKGLEIFLANRRSFLFVFDSHETVKRVVEFLPAVGVGASYGLPRTRAVSLYSPRQLFKRSNMLQRWKNEEITNFEYLMFLNTIAGRTYNDLNQYFIFPWIIKDYESEKLNINNSEIYRDLSKPIGALNPFRLGGFIERFNSWDSDSEIPPFHYGTHYSTGGFVLNWLVRVEPFASLFLSLQGGKFDHPLRTFSSIKRAWDNCQKDTSDVKELIPELFYLPEMLKNDCKFVWGENEDGEQIDDVILPNWAKSPESFIKIHQEALESSYVSNNIHKWIDLIFGYKQKGKEAEHSANVFYHLTYEGSVDIDAVTDNVTKEALVQQIKSFGQTPPQLLTSPHPARYAESVEGDDQHKNIYLTFSVTPDVPVTHVSANTSIRIVNPAIITISCNQVFSVNKWINYSGGDITSYHSLKHVQIEQDPSLETFQGRSRRQLGEPLDENVTVTSSCFIVTSDNKYIFTCGYWDKSFKCFSTEAGKLIQCIFGHWDVVTCLSYSDDELTSSNAIIVSGGADATVLVWIWDHKSHRIIGPSDSSGHGSTPIAICTGHEFPIACVDVNSSIGIIASGSLEGPCLLHSISGDLLYSLEGPSICNHPRLITISNNAQVLVNYADETGYMAMFTVNGKILSHVKLAEQNLAVVFTKDGCFFVAGGFGRCFQVWRSFDLALLSVFPPCDGSIRSLALTQDQKCMVAGLSIGSIIAMAMDFSMWPRIFLPPSTNSLSQESHDTAEASSVGKDTLKKDDNHAENVSTAIVHKVPDDVKKSTSLTQPVPNDDTVSTQTKTLLEKSMEKENGEEAAKNETSDDVTTTGDKSDNISESKIENADVSETKNESSEKQTESNEHTGTKDDPISTEGNEDAGKEE